MNRREWLGIAARLGLASALAGCSSSPSPRINRAAAERLGGEGFGFWERGRLRASRNLDLRLPALSITKSVAALAVVRAVGEGWLALDQPLTDILPEWRGNPAKSRITLRMLVNQTAGFPAGVAELYRGVIPSKGAVAISLPVVDPPASQFRYGPASDEILAEVLRRKLLPRRSTTEDFLREILAAIRLSSPRWRKDGSGQIYLSTGAEFSVRELGRLGAVIGKLASGRNAAGLKSAVFLDLAAPRSANPMVAAGIWWNRNATKPGAFAIQPERQLDRPQPPGFWQHACLAPDLDAAWIALVGSGGKRVYVQPERDIVIAQLSRDAAWNDGAYLRAVSA